MADRFVNRIGVVAEALSGDPRDAVRHARVAGIDGLLFAARSGAVDLTTLSASGQREFRQALSSQQRAIVGLRYEPGAKGFSPGADVDRELHRLARTLEAARGLQAPLVCIDVGPLPRAEVEQKEIGPSNVSAEMAGLILIPSAADVAKAQAAKPRESGEQRTSADEVFETQLDAVMIELGQIADRMGVMLAMRSGLASMASLERMLKRAACPWFAVDLDPVHLFGEDLPADQVFDRIGSLVRHVRVRDALRGAGQRTSPTAVGRGNVDWGEIASLLDDAGYSGWMTIDPLDLPDRASAIVAALKLLRAI